MKIIEARNVHQAIPQAIALMRHYGEARDSRNGPVLQAPWPVATVYERPFERLAFHPERDINTAFLVYEALWMLAGRNDLEPLLRYVKTFGNYSDDGSTLHGAYGYRWRQHFDHYNPSGPPWITGFDQIDNVIERLKRNPLDRRCVVSMWDAEDDATYEGKDAPCNLTITFQTNYLGALDMVVFNRSNDIVWGAYFANAFHFSILLDYVANAAGIPVGTYTQASVNWHAYRSTYTLFEGIPTVLTARIDPYAQNITKPTRIEGEKKRVDELVSILLEDADNGTDLRSDGPDEPWAKAAWVVLASHDIHRRHGAAEALNFLREQATGDMLMNDWVGSMCEWLMRRANRVQA